MFTFKGTGVALVTPFLNGSVDYPSLERMIDHVIGTGEGVDYIVSLGSTGESLLLSEEERRTVLDFTINVAKGRVPVVAGNFGGGNTRQMVRYLEDFDFRGIDAILSSCPAYVKPTQEGLYQHYKALADACPVRIILYNVPGRTSVNMLPGTTCRIARDCHNVVAIKEASGLDQQNAELLKCRADEFLILSGDDPSAIGLLESGGDGVISVIANLYPAEFSGMVSLSLKGEYSAARRIHDGLYSWHDPLYAEGNPAGIKAALHLAGLISSPEVRLPLTPLTTKHRETMSRLLRGTSI